MQAAFQKSTKASHSTMVKGYFDLLKKTGTGSGYDGISAWLANYVPNGLRTGYKHSRSASSLRSLYSSLLKQLKLNHGLRLTEVEEGRLDQQLEGIMTRR